MSALCTWCGTAYEPRSNGGSAQRFCSAPCRRAFDTACRIWAAQEYEAERVSIFTLRTALYQRARSLQRDPASASPKTTHPGCRTAPCEPPRRANINGGRTWTLTLFLRASRSKPSFSNRSRSNRCL